MHSENLQRVEGGRRTRGEVRARPPLISIITVVFRDREELENILNNVFAFDPSAFELIVIDGGSTDGTVELLQRWDHQVDYWLSEPDSGIYDAMNKGIRAATGTYIFHLNAGDRLTHLPVEELTAASQEQVEVAAFRVLDDGKNEFLPSRGRWLRLRNTLHHQGTFYSRHSFPAYDLQYRALADFDVNQRLAQRGAKMKVFDRCIASHASGGISHSKLAASEHLWIIRKNYGWMHGIAAWIVIHKSWPRDAAAHLIKKVLMPRRSSR